MRAILLRYLDEVLSEFHFYRKKKKGTWYKVQDTAEGGGFAGPPCFWTRNPGSLEVIKEECYEKKKL